MPQSLDENSLPVAGPASHESAIGEPIRLFRPQFRYRAVVGTIGTLIIAGGIVLAVMIHPFMLCFPALLGLLPLGFAYLMGKMGILLCTGGVVRLTIGRSVTCLWHQISRIEVEKRKDGLTSMRQCVLGMKEGPGITLTDFGIERRFEEMLGVLREQAEINGVAWIDKR